MKIVGLMPVRNEAWCLGFTLRVALKWCDQVVLLLHACTDQSLQIVADIQSEVTDRVSFFVEPAEQWNEMKHRQQMLEGARCEHAATNIAIVDADEFITANLLDEIRGRVACALPGQMIELPGYNTREVPGSAMLGTSLYYHSNGVWGNRWFATAFRDSPGLHWAGDRFHHREPFGCGWNRWRPIPQGCGGTVHLWGASERRLRAKHALYRITERLRWPQKSPADIERLYSLATLPREPWTFHPIPADWLEPYGDLMQYLDINAEPWQEQEVRSVLEAHGREKFRGLDLLGY